jgi:hypothetical protein
MCGTGESTAAYRGRVAYESPLRPVASDDYDEAAIVGHREICEPFVMRPNGNGVVWYVLYMDNRMTRHQRTNSTTKQGAL